MNIANSESNEYLSCNVTVLDTRAKRLRMRKVSIFNN